MTNVLEPHDYDKSVFINCPFDGAYELLFHGIVFAVRHLEFQPKSALGISDAGQPRIDKILDLITKCKYSIHDLSRTELDPNHGLPRFNVPFELGLDLGCKKFGRPRYRQKMVLILDAGRYRYRNFISDIAGLDIEEHNGSVATAITVVRNWLRSASDALPVAAPSGPTIYSRYEAFQLELPQTCYALNWDVDNLPFADFSWAVYDWIKNNPLRVNP
jgi:hypothetical protein